MGLLLLRAGDIIHANAITTEMAVMLQQFVSACQTRAELRRRWAHARSIAQSHFCAATLPRAVDWWHGRAQALQLEHNERMWLYGHADKTRLAAALCAWHDAGLAVEMERKSATQRREVAECHLLFGSVQWWAKYCRLEQQLESKHLEHAIRFCAERSLFRALNRYVQRKRHRAEVAAGVEAVHLHASKQSAMNTWRSLCIQKDCFVTISIEIARRWCRCALHNWRAITSRQRRRVTLEAIAAMRSMNGAQTAAFEAWAQLCETRQRRVRLLRRGVAAHRLSLFDTAVGIWHAKVRTLRRSADSVLAARKAIALKRTATSFGAWARHWASVTAALQAFHRIIASRRLRVWQTWWSELQCAQIAHRLREIRRLKLLQRSWNTWVPFQVLPQTCATPVARKAGSESGSAERTSSGQRVRLLAADATRQTADRRALFCAEAVHTQPVGAVVVLGRMSSLARVERLTQKGQAILRVRRLQSSMLTWLERCRLISQYSAAKLWSARLELHRGIASLISYRQDRLKLPGLARSFWIASILARRLMIATICSLRENTIEAQRMDERAIAFYPRRVKRWALAAWSREIQGRRMLSTASANVFIITSRGLLREHCRKWRRASSIHGSFVIAARTLKRRCLARHWKALVQLCQQLAAGRVLLMRVYGRIYRVHFLAFAEVCARRIRLRQQATKLRQRSQIAGRRRVFRGWRRQLGVSSAVAALQRSLLENLAIDCWRALVTHMLQVRRERARETHYAAVVGSALRADPKLRDIAYRTLARLRLLIIGRAICSWAAYASGRAHRRRAGYRLVAAARINLLRHCLWGWREAMWHSQLMRHVRSELQEERRNAEAVSHGTLAGSSYFTSAGGLVFGATPLRPARPPEKEMRTA